MEKKEYIKPEMKVYQIETPSILAGSEIKVATEDDYGNLDDLPQFGIRIVHKKVGSLTNILYLYR